MTLLISCFPILISNLVYALIIFLSRYYIERIYGSNSLGVYASISAPALVIPMLASYIYTPFMPLFSKYFMDNDKSLLIKLIKKLGLIILFLGTLILLAGYFLGEWGLTLLFGEEIREYVYLLVPILISVICTALVFYLNSIVISLRDFKTLIIGSLIAVLFSLILPYNFVSNSINGASIYLIVVQSIQVVVVAIGLIRKIRHGHVQIMANK